MRRGRLRSLTLAIPALLSGCPDDTTPSASSESTASSGSTEPTTTTASPTTTLDPDTSTSVDPDTSTTEDPSTTSTTTEDPSSSSTDPPLDGCGDGDIDAGELCDGRNLDGRDCASEDFVDGVLACNDDCTLDTSGCNALCGDGNVQGDEQCEAGDLDGADCLSQGFDGGDLSCANDCTFDTSACEDYVCGDGMRVGTETCDGADLDGETCTSQGFDGGALACAGDCAAFDTSGCYVCGDGMIAQGEQCDGNDLAGQTCVSLGLEGGVLGCNDACFFDTSECTGCGNGDQDPGEECDGLDLGGITCASLGFDSGTPACNADCTISGNSCFGTHEFCTAPNAAIGPDGGSLTASSLEVAGLLGEVIDVDIVVQALHSYPGDLVIDVGHVDGGTQVLLSEYRCAGNSDIAATYDQDALSSPDCVPPVGIEGEVLPEGDLDAFVAAANGGNGVWELEIFDDADGDGGTLQQWCVQITNELGVVECSNGATLLATNPAGDEVVCDDPTDTTCEQDAEQLCPAGWNLCSMPQHNNRNDGFDYQVAFAPIVVGEIYCRGGNAGAGHFTLGPYDNITNLSQDAPVNCGYGSSRDACPSGFGCNELAVQALCCAPDPLCGNGVVDGPEELCDDGNADETDACLNSCSWRVPTDNGQFGTGC